MKTSFGKNIMIEWIEIYDQDIIFITGSVLSKPIVKWNISNDLNSNLNLCPLGISNKKIPIDLFKRRHNKSFVQIVLLK